MSNAPEVPFAADDGLFHRVSADTQRDWIEENYVNPNVRLLTQCGSTLVGRIHRINSHMVNCLACICNHVRGSIWLARVGDTYAFEYESRDAKFNKTLKVVRVDGKQPDDFVYFEDGTHAKQKHLEKVRRT